MHIGYIYQTSRVNYAKTMTFKFKFENQITCEGIEPWLNKKTLPLQHKLPTKQLDPTHRKTCCNFINN
jgi:hypothetical protein